MGKAHRGSYPWKRGWIEEGGTMFGYGLLGTLLVICLIVWIIKRMWGGTTAAANESMKKRKKKPGNEILARIQKEMALPRMSKSARIAELESDTARVAQKPRTVMPGIADKIIRFRTPRLRETAQISIEGEPRYWELRVENSLTDEHGDEVRLEKGGHVEVTVTAEAKSKPIEKLWRTENARIRALSYRLNSTSVPGQIVASLRMISTHLAVQPRTGEKIEYCIPRIEMDEQISAREWFFRQAPCASIDEFFGYRRLGSLSSPQSHFLSDRQISSWLSGHAPFLTVSFDTTFLLCAWPEGGIIFERHLSRSRHFLNPFPTYDQDRKRPERWLPQWGVFKRSAMLSPSIYPWFSAYRAAVLEPDFTLVPERVREALRVIHDRLNGPAQIDDAERQAVVDARAGLGKLNSESVSEWDGRTTDEIVGK
jgi:hypothetical protein